MILPFLDNIEMYRPLSLSICFALFFFLSYLVCDVRVFVIDTSYLYISFVSVGISSLVPRTLFDEKKQWKKKYFKR